MSELKNDEVLKKSADRIHALLDAININLLLVGACSVISVILLALILWRIW